MALHIQRHAPLEGVIPQQGVQHPDHLRALLVDRGGIEIIDRLVVIRLHRMGRRPRIFPELGVAQHRHVLDPVEGVAMQIGREALVAENGESLLQRQLEPVTAGDAVARPVVEILMGDHTFDALQFAIAGRFGIGEHQLGVENVEALVLHGAHVEVAHGDDVVLVEVVLQAIDALVPLHRPLQGGHGVGGEGGVARLHVQAQLHRPAAGGDEAALDLLELAGHQGEEVGGLGERVVPDGVVTRFPAGPRRQIAALDAVAVGEQHRATGPVGLDPHPEAAEQVGAIRVVGDAAEPFRLALGGDHPPADVEPFEGGVGPRIEPHRTGDDERLLGRLQHQQAVALQPVGVGGQGHAIELQGAKLQIHPLQLQGRDALLRPCRPRPRQERQPRLHQGMVGEQTHRQVGALEEIGRRLVVGEVDDGHLRLTWGPAWRRPAA